MRITRPIVLLALAVMLAPHVEASRTSAWESKPPSSLTATRADEVGLLASLAPVAAADVEITEALRFDLGDVVLVESELEHEDRFGLGPLDLLGPAPLRGPPPSYPETRVRGFELLPPFRVGASPRLSLWSRQACGWISCGLVSDRPEDPWGLMVGDWWDPRTALANPHVSGTLKALGGGAEITAGIAAASTPTGVGQVVGAAAFLHGIDTFISGVKQAVTGRSDQTLTSRGIEQIATVAGASPSAAYEIAEGGDAVIGAGLTMGAASASRGLIGGGAGAATKEGSTGPPVREQLRDEKGRFLPKNGEEVRPGGPFEEKVGEVLGEINEDVVHHARIRTPSGVTVEVDYASRNPRTGRLMLTEAKGSSTAGFTPNQRVGYPEIAVSGGTVVGTGSPALPAGLKIPPTRVRVVRPAAVERLERLRAAAAGQ